MMIFMGGLGIFLERKSIEVDMAGQTDQQRSFRSSDEAEYLTEPSRPPTIPFIR